MVAPPKFDPVHDVISGAIMAATSLPQLIAYAEIVGYAGHRGLSTAGPPLLAWGLATGSPWTNAGVTSLTATMARTDLVPGDGHESYVSEHGEEGYMYLVSAYSLWVGFASLLLAAAGFGRLARRVPGSVRAGFKWGCEVGVLTSALPGGLFYHGFTSGLLGLAADSGFGRVARCVRWAFPDATGVVGVTNAAFALAHPWSWDLDAFFVFVNCTAFVMMGRDWILPHWTPLGSEVVIAAAAATAFSVLTDYRGGVVGEMPSPGGLGGAIHIDFLDVRRLLGVPLAERCFGGSTPMLLLSAAIFSGVNYLSIVAISSGFERDDGVPWSASRELLAQGASNVVAGLVGSAPVSGSMSRSLVSRMTGATSRLACVVTATIWMCAMPYASAMSRTPRAALSAVIMSAVASNVVAPSGLLALRGPDLFVGIMTAIVTAIVSPTMGFFLGCVLHLSVRMGIETKKKKEKVA
jgi:SulP family sulfate permease